MDEETLALIEAVRHGCRITDGQDPLDEAADLRLKHRGLEGIVHWVDEDGFALVRDGELDLAVRPEARQRGVGGRLATLATSTPGRLAAWSHGDHTGAAVLAQRHGFDRARDLWVMRRDADLALPDAPAPDGVTVRRYTDADADALLAVNAAAFADHAEQGALDHEGLAQRMAEPWFDPAGLLVAVDEKGALLGFHWTKRHDADRGEVYVVGVAPAGQGRGLGRVLTVAGLAHLAARGISEVHLYVEADNTAATALYAGLGFAHGAADSHVQYLRP